MPLPADAEDTLGIDMTSFATSPLTSLLEVCINVVVAVEPQLQPLQGEELGRSANTDDSARLDICATGFWLKSQDASFDLRVFYPFVSNYQSTWLMLLYK